MLKEFKRERQLYAKQQRIAERELLPIFRKALKDSISQVIDYVKNFGTETNPIFLIDESIWQKAYSKAYNQIGIKIAKQEYYRQRGLENTKADGIGFLIDVWTSLFKDYATNYIYKIATDLNANTIKIITEALGEINALGLDKDGAVRLFEKTVNGKMKLRSLVISRTESTTITNLGKEIGAMAWLDESGQSGFKVWLGRNDKRERQSHLSENDTIIKLSDKYNLDGQLCDRPGDITLTANQRINCRCTQSIISERLYNLYVKRGRIVNGKLIGAS